MPPILSSSKASVMILSRNMLKRVHESRHPCRTPNCFLEPISYAAVKQDCASGLVIEVFDVNGSGSVSIGGRTISNFRFDDDIDGFAGEEELAKLVERLDKTFTAYGMEINAEKTS